MTDLRENLVEDLRRHAFDDCGGFAKIIDGHIATEAAETIIRLTAQNAALMAERDAGLSPDEAWQDLVDKSDRTSPEEYPDMALITFDELADYMRSSSTDTIAFNRGLEEAAKVIETLNFMGGNLDGWVNQNESLIYATRYHMGEAIRALKSDSKEADYEAD